MNILEARDFYTNLGIDTIPLRPDDNKGDETGKAPLYLAWQKKEPYRMWNSAPQNANLGLRGGGDIGAAFLDCDDKNQPGTFDNVTRFLSGLGVTDYPLVQTASGIGRHIYLTVTDTPNGDACDLAKTIGEGEFRYGPGAYIVAAPSIVDGRSYCVLSGDFNHIPNVSYSDLRPILGETKNTQKRSPTIPRNAYPLLYGNAGSLIKFDNNRSRAEQALLLALANADFEYPDVLWLFNNNPCAGKYNELKTANPRNAERWLLHSFTKAQKDAQKDSKKRETIMCAISWANTRTWEGRGGPGEQAVFLAHMEIAYKAGRVTGWAASKRDLADLAGVSEASKINKRILRDGWLTIDRQSTVDCAQTYSLSTALPLPEFVVCEEVVTLCDHDVFRKTIRWNLRGKRITLGFGKIGYQLWMALQTEPMTANDLAIITGHGLRTVQKYLEQMRSVTDQRTGEVLCFL